MAPTLLMLVRHGQTAGNLAGGTLLQGRTDLPLTVEGLRQARRLAARLEAGSFRAIYSSPLQRAAATAREIAAVHRDAPVAWCPALQEIDCGRLDGLDVDSVRRRHRSRWEANQRQDDPDFRWPGGESYRELRRRSVAACDRIAAQHPGSAVLVVTHAGVVNQVVGSFMGVDPARWEVLRPGHCTVTTVEWHPHDRRLLAFDRSL